MIARQIKYRDLTYNKVADAIGMKRGRFANLVKGNIYPSPDELAELEAFFSLPAKTLFEEELLRFRLDWPVRQRHGKAGE